jgi:hypothetical protein
MSIWLKNTRGKRDATLTFALVAFVVVVVKFLLSGVSLAVGDHTVSFGELESGLVAAMLTPTLGAYCARRFTDATAAKKDDDGSC